VTELFPKSNLCVPVLVGPTASGKTKLGIALAESLHGEIVSADSRQIYRHLDIGTAKPTEEERRRVPHHFINLFEPNRMYSAGEYGRDARSLIEQLLCEGKRPILVGGSGLYIRAVLDGFFEGPARDPELLERLKEELHLSGAEAMYARLQEVDPAAAAKMDATKEHRVLRALEVYYTTGIPISEHHERQNTAPSFPAVQFGVEWDRTDLYRRIERRVDEMIANGLETEVQSLREKGFAPHLNALNSVGYRELFDMLDGKLTKSGAVDLIKRNTRRFAKRQMTWFRADRRIRWVRADESTDWTRLAQSLAESIRACDEHLETSN